MIRHRVEMQEWDFVDYNRFVARSTHWIDLFGGTCITQSDDECAGRGNIFRGSTLRMEGRALCTGDARDADTVGNCDFCNETEVE
jgi:hypothetical protein